VKIALAGTAHTSSQAPFADPAWEIWGCSPNQQLERWDRWFELHDPELLREPSHALYLKWLGEQTKPIYIQKPMPEIPNGVVYPAQKVAERFGTWFLTSTVAFMLALALMEFPDEIALYGIEMAAKGEYASQKPGCRFFIQTARLIGIKVWAPKGCEIMEDGFLYGYPDARLMLREKALIRRKELLERIATLNSTHTQLLTEQLLLRGRLEITIPDEDVRARLAQVIATDNQLEREALTLNGALEDQDHILDNWC
jgi:hypothetical protein